MSAVFDPQEPEVLPPEIIEPPKETKAVIDGWWHVSGGGFNEIVKADSIEDAASLFLLHAKTEPDSVQPADRYPCNGDCVLVAVKDGYRRLSYLKE